MSAQAGYDKKEPEQLDDGENVLERKARGNPNAVYTDATVGKNALPGDHGDRRSYLHGEKEQDAAEAELAGRRHAQGHSVSLPDHIDLPPLATQSAPASAPATATTRPPQAATSRPRIPALPARPKP